jgi:hypothetical protein
MSRAPGRDRSPVVAAVRYGLPAAIVIAGLLLTVVGGSDTAAGAGVVLIGVGLLVGLGGVLMRLGIESNRDRDREEEARRYFDQHGRWPGRGPTSERRHPG